MIVYWEGRKMEKDEERDNALRGGVGAPTPTRKSSPGEGEPGLWVLM